MYRLETTKPLWDEMKALLPDICPNMPIRLVSEDPNLVALGFTDRAPCVIELDVDEKKFAEIRDIFFYLEVDAFNTADGKNPPESDPDYQRYLKYGWIGDVLSGAQKVK